MLMQVIFSRQDAPGSLAIRAATLSAWSHVAIVIGNGQVVEATAAHGVITRSLGSFLAAADATSVMLVDVPDQAAAIAFLCGQIGAPYDWGAYAGFLMPWRRWDDDARWFCSELVAAALRAGGCTFVPDRAWAITPRELRAMIRGAA